MRFLRRNLNTIAQLAEQTSLTLFAPVLSPHDPIENSLYDQLKPPIWQQGGSSENLLGTDDLGRDILSRIIFGARVSLMVGVVSVGIAVLFGAFLGAVAGYFRGWPDNIIMRIMDIILSFPGILLAIVIVAYLGPGLRNAMMAIGIISIPQFARIVQASLGFGSAILDAAGLSFLGLGAQPPIPSRKDRRR